MIGDAGERVRDVIDHPAVLAQVLGAAGQELRVLGWSRAGERVGLDPRSLDPAEDLRRSPEEDGAAAANEECATGRVSYLQDTQERFRIEGCVRFHVDRSRQYHLVQ